MDKMIFNRIYYQHTSHCDNFIFSTYAKYINALYFIIPHIAQTVSPQQSIMFLIKSILPAHYLVPRKDKFLLHF